MTAATITEVARILLKSGQEPEGVATAVFYLLRRSARRGAGINASEPYVIPADVERQIDQLITGAWPREYALPAPWKHKE